MASRKVITAPRLALGAIVAHPRERMIGWLALAPALLFLALFFFVPVLVFSIRSVYDGSPTLDHYARIVREDVYTQVFVTTIKIAALVTLLAVLLGYPYAYAMARARSKVRLLLLLLVLLPFCTSLLVRTFSFMIMLQREGIVNRALLDAHLISEPIPMVYNAVGVLIGMTYMLLPYLVLPLYSVIAGIDPVLEKAAMGLGAGRVRAFYSTVLPLSLPGLLAGAALVFVLSLGFFVTPALLGGRREQMIAMLMERRINELLDWGFASALSVVLSAMALLLGILLLAAHEITARRTAFTDA